MNYMRIPKNFQPEAKSLPFFKVDMPSLVLTLIIATAAIFFMIGVVSLQVINEARQGLPISNGWSWPKLIGFDLFLLLCLAAAFWHVRCHYRTIITQTYIYQPGFFASKLIYWSEVTHLEQGQNYGLHIHAPNQRIILALAAYRNPFQITSEIEKLIESNKAKAS